MDTLGRQAILLLSLIDKVNQVLYRDRVRDPDSVAGYNPPHRVGVLREPAAYSFHVAGFFISLMLCSASLAVEILPGLKVPQHSLVHVKYDATENGVVFVLGIQGGQLISPDMVDVNPGYLVFTGPPGSYSVHGIEGGKRFSQTVEITGRVVPVPPPDPIDPVVPLTGFALEVYREAAKVNDPSSAERMADNFATVIAQIDTGSLVTPKMISDKIAELNRTVPLGPGWTVFGKWLGGKFTAMATTVSKTRTLMIDVEAGLRAVE